MPVIISGRLSLIVLAAAYAVMAGALILRRDTAHRVKVYHGQAYIDCAVDGDDNPYTCVSDYTVLKLFSFNAAYVFGAALMVSAVFCVIQMGYQRRHEYSVVYYADSLLSNSIMTFAVAVVTGVQSSSALLLMAINTVMYEVGMYYHDVGYWAADAGTGACPSSATRFTLYVVLNFITLSVNLVATAEYWHVSAIPAFIPLIMLTWFTHFIMLRFFTFRYFYGTLPSVLRRAADGETASLFKSTTSPPTTYDVVRREDPYSVDWQDSWKNGLNFFFKVAVAAIFFVGTSEVEITYV